MASKLYLALAIPLALAGALSYAQAQPKPVRHAALTSAAPPASAIVVGTGGCQQDGPPQAGLPGDVLTVHSARGPIRFKVQIAGDDATREKGLMFVRQMADNTGMIFDFHNSQTVAFWMHNTYIPLDMLFIGADGRIVSTARNAKACDDGNIPSGGPVRTVVEINAGLVDRLGIKAGDKVTSERIYPAR